MSFGSGGFGGFGQNNNNTTGTTSAFGGFGANNNNTSSGFGSGTGFGAANNNTGGSLFGSNNTTGGFGGGATSGFGSAAAKPAFGAGTSTGTGLFGNTANNASGSTFGGFGSGSSGFGTNNNAAATTGGFGAGGSLFGAKSAATTGFGSNTAGTGSTLFGNNTSTGTTSGFGGGAFGATSNPGIGTNVGDPPGTANVAFVPTNEKEANNPTQSNSFQNILFMDAYKKWSAEELRLADYNQGRRFGGGTGGSAFGQGAFGSTPATTGGFGAATTSSTFGGGGSTLFGSGQNTGTSGFGAASNTGSAFGAGTGFGQKPATTGGLFGGGGNTTTPSTGGGLFGNNAGSGFGAASNTTTGFGQNNATTGGGLFGNTNNNAAAKPAGFGGFGGTQTNTGSSLFGGGNTGTSAFGTNTATSNTGGGLFGNTNNQSTTGGGLFGQPQANTGSAFGAATQNTSSGLFGNAQQKPTTTGLFGSTPNTNTGGGLFGNTNNNTTTAGFGAANTTQNAGGLFGAKPATTGSSLFGNTTAGQTGTTGGGLFGGLNTNQTQQPAQSGGLFGGQNNQAKPLFGAAPSAGGGLFGQSNNQQQAGGLFGNAGQQQQPTLGSSLFNNTQNAQAAPQSFSTSITDLSAYGASSLFSNLPDDKIHNPGPLATPLSGHAKAKSRSILPMYKLSPANATRFVTPQKRGFGFSYGTYGTPNSPSSASSTPGGLNQSLLGGSINRALSKSMSASNLRRSMNVDDSILLPGAFSSSTGPRLLGSNGSGHKKLVINRDLRSGDLFTSPSKDKLVQEPATAPRKLIKRVSFDTPSSDAAENGSRDEPSTPRANGADESARPVNGVNNTQAPQSTDSPEMQQVKGNELAIVHEEESNAGTPRASLASSHGSSGGDRAAGAYWTDPPLEEIQKMNRIQRQKVANFTVGRENVGQVSFKVPVDLSNIDLDHLFDEIVILVTRSATVYPNPAKKPPVGKGLNVPALIQLEQSWPRGKEMRDKNSRRVQKHIERLKKIADTKFEDYDVEGGIWTFSVEHFTTYGLDEDEDEDEEDETAVDAAPISTSKELVLVDEDNVSPETDPDDTFQFKQGRKSLPGAFEAAPLSDDEEDDSFEQPLRAPSVSSEEVDRNEMSYDYAEDERMAEAAEFGSVADEGSVAGEPVEEQDESAISRSMGPDRQVPAGIMRARMRALRKSTAPTKIEVAGGNDWTQILQESVKAPRTVDRVTLRALNESGAVWDAKDRGSPEPKNRDVGDGAGFATSIDLMKSLFEQSRGPAQPAQAPLSTRGFVKWPYRRSSKVDEPGEVPVPRPRWGPDGVLVTVHGEELASENVDAELSPISDGTIHELENFVQVLTTEHRIRSPEEGAYGDDAKWKLAAILALDDAHDNFLTFWQQLLSDATAQSLSQASSAEEKALVSLAGNKIDQACELLLSVGNFRLATLISCIGTQIKDMRTQVKDWREANVLSEFSDATRALYELLGGNACVCAGAKAVPMEHRVESFVISERFHLDWMQAFGLRLFCSPGTSIEQAVLSFQADVDQGKEPQPEGDALWDLLKVFANRKFDWAAVDSIGWLLTLVLTVHNSRAGIDFGAQATAELDHACVSFASTLTSHGQWVHATFVLSYLHQRRDGALLDHLGRHAHWLGSPEDSSSPFSLFLKAGDNIPANRLWEAKALYFRSRQEHKQEFLALLRAKSYEEANTTFLDRLAPELVISRDYYKLYQYAGLLYKVKHRIDWNKGTVAYLLFPILRDSSQDTPLGRLDQVLFDALGGLRGNTKASAALADMAQDLIKARGHDPRLYQLLPEDMRDRYFRDAVLATA